MKVDVSWQDFNAMNVFVGILDLKFCKTPHVSNRWVNLDQTWQECSLRGPLQKLFAELIPSKTLVAMATKLNFLSSSLKIFFSGTPIPILK